MIKDKTRIENENSELRQQIEHLKQYEQQVQAHQNEVQKLRKFNEEMSKNVNHANIAKDHVLSENVRNYVKELEKQVTEYREKLILAIKERESIKTNVNYTLKAVKSAQTDAVL